MKHIVLFSGGANSSYLAWLVSKEQDKRDVILLHTPTYTEHPDADRFREQVSEYIGIPITVQADGRDVWQLIKDNHCLPSERIPFCSRTLKSEQAAKFYKILGEEFIVYFGYDATEWRRVQRTSARLEVSGYKAEYPLLDWHLSSDDIKDIIRNEWKICLPEPYLYLNHNNCLPCFKGGQKHFYQVWKHYPDYYAMAEKAEKDIYPLYEHTVFKDTNLTKLREQWQSQMPMFPDEDDMRPCMCAL
jgi:3'-phosphoadenosine 5'-phosphosulfate sulfotransferase (PAPS reductase)/FAD synthetase